MPKNDPTEYDHTQYQKQGVSVYPLSNPIKKGYGVKEPDVNPAGKKPSGRMVNQKNEKIDFWIEDIKANFGMTGSTAQSRNVRQFFPHNVTQPSITVTGRAPNSFQYNRMASFVRASHWNAFHPGELGAALRHDDLNGKTVQVQTVRLIVRNGNGDAWNGHKKGRHQHVKGVHKPWVLEGYIKSMKAGARKENQAPQFEFEFFIAESTYQEGGQGQPAIGIWNDERVFGNELKPWLDWIKKDGMFVTVHDKQASESKLEEEKKIEKVAQEIVETIVNPLW